MNTRHALSRRFFCNSGSVIAALPGIIWLLHVSAAGAAVRYVDANSASPAPPFTSWQSAARTIQDAIDLAVAGDEIVVTNGVYNAGRGKTRPGSSLTNRVCIDKPLKVRSLNGPQVTIIEGYQTTPRWADTSVAVRCAYLADGAVLEGFTLRKGDTQNKGHWLYDQCGGGVLCDSTNGVVSRCIIQESVAYQQGGGAFGGRLENCLIVRNSATNGAGGACSNLLVHCTVVRNYPGAGVTGARLVNSIIWQNLQNHSASVFEYSCATPLPPGPGNINQDPLFENELSDWRIRPESPCVDKGNTALSAGLLDLEGNLRQTGVAVDMGAYEPGARPPQVMIEPVDRRVVVGHPAEFTVQASGSGALRYQWWFGAQRLAGETNTTLVITNAAAAQAGGYYVAITNLYGWTNSRTAMLTVTEPVTHYVNVNSANRTPPFTSWATATYEIQLAIEAASPGDIILVTNGIYRTGGKPVTGSYTNVVAVDKPLTIRSVNGPKLTLIQGRQGWTMTNSVGAARCVYLGSGSSLTGFTLMGGATHDGGIVELTDGGGAWCAPDAVLSQCIVRHNSASYRGGGVYGGVLDNCVIYANSAPNGAGASMSVLRNCTVMGNTGYNSGGLHRGSAFNSIIISNTATFYMGQPNHAEAQDIRYCCVSPLFVGEGNVELNPRVMLFAQGDLRLAPDSPCIELGNNSLAVGLADADGKPRLFGSRVDLGAYEYQGVFTPIAPTVVFAPTNQAVLAGDDARFWVGASGTEPLVYQWKYNGQNVLSGTNALLVITNAQALNEGVYTVWITNRGGEVVSQPATLTIRTPVTRFINAASTAPQSPFTSWTTAARALQDAAELSLAGDEIVVTNGSYASGERIWLNATNRVLVPARVSVRSVNGPGVTVIEGATNMRCVYLSDRARLTGFTLRGGNAKDGAGVWCESSAKLSHCILASNIASSNAGGAWAGYLENCVLERNHAYQGGAAAYSTLKNCTVANNSATNTGGGLLFAQAFNTIIWSNQAPVGANYSPMGSNAVLHYVCTIPIPPWLEGNVPYDPRFVNLQAGDYRLAPDSPCINTGENDYSSESTDLAGTPRIFGDRIDIGAYEHQGPYAPVLPTITQQPASQQARLGDRVTLSVSADGTPPLTYQWQFNSAYLPGATASSLVLNSLTLSQLGAYTVRVSGPGGSIASEPAIVSRAAFRIFHVDAASPGPEAPYATWETAARTIQEAVNLALQGEEVVVADGDYSVGGRLVTGSTFTNRVVITNSVIVRSANGPAVTRIIGGANTRCAYLASGATLDGFTLTQGAANMGAGVFCESNNAFVLNSLIVSNSASWIGGGALGGSLSNCVLTGNSAGFGAGASSFWNERPCELSACVISSNTAATSGGGVENCSIQNCLLLGNRAVGGKGGGVYFLSGGWLRIENCTIALNAAQEGGGIWATNGVIVNSIIYYNQAPSGQNWAYDSWMRMPEYRRCCIVPNPYEWNPWSLNWGFTNEPAFLDLSPGDLRLRADSPCIDAGMDYPAVHLWTDLDGLPRVVGERVDIGAYEFQGVSSLPFQQWLGWHGLPNDGSADNLDSDADGAGNYQEWLAGTNPTNAASALRLLQPLLTGTNLVIRWESAPGVSYSIERSRDLAPQLGFETVATNLVGSPVTNGTAGIHQGSFSDTNDPAAPLRFYRLKAGK